MSFEEYENKIGFNVKKSVRDLHLKRWNSLTPDDRIKVEILMRGSRYLDMQVSLSELVRHRLDWRLAAHHENHLVLINVDAKTFKFPDNTTNYI